MRRLLEAYLRPSPALAKWHGARFHAEELKLFVERYGLKWRDDKPLKRFLKPCSPPHPAEAGC
jgi:hypothetical protein